MICAMIKGKKITAYAIFLVVVLAASPLQAGEANNKYPFDPSTIETDGGWEEFQISEITDYGWCGTDKTVIRRRFVFYLMDMYSKKSILVLHVDEKKPFYTKFVGCTQDNRYIFFERRDAEKPVYIEIYDVKSGKPVKVLTVKSDYRKWPSILNGDTSLLSPDGKYLAWHSKKTAALSDGKEISIIPVFNEVSDQALHIEWSKDSKKAFILDWDKQHRLLIYDVVREKLSVFRLELGDFYARILKLSSDENKLYIWGWHQQSGDNRIFKLDLKNLHSEKPIVTPGVFLNNVGPFTTGPGNTLIFSVYPHCSKPSHLPNEFAGLFVADEQGNVIKRLTKGMDMYPSFSRNGTAITFLHCERAGGRWRDKGYALIKKKAD